MLSSKFQLFGSRKVVSWVRNMWSKKYIAPYLQNENETFSNKAKVLKDGNTKVERTVLLNVYANYGETEAEFYFHSTLKKYKGMLEFYQLRGDRQRDRPYQVVKCEDMK